MKHPLTEAAKHCGISEETVASFVFAQWISPFDPENQLFDDEDVARIRLIHQLQGRMGVNEEGVTIILHLLDQLNHLHREIPYRVTDVNLSGIEP